MGKPLHVLMIEDTEDDVQLTLLELKHGGYDVTFARVDTAAAMNAALNEGRWDLILSDYSMPSFDAPSALKLMQDKGFDLPFIIISGTVGEDVAVAAMKAGAHDFFSKNKLTLLIPAVERELREAQERNKRQMAESSLLESEERYRNLVEFSPIGIVVQIFDHIVYSNPAAVRLIGADNAKMLLGHSILDFVPVEYHELISERIAQSHEEQLQLEHVEHKLQQISGQVLDVELLVSSVTHTGQQASQFILHDITERKRAEDAVLAQERFLRQVIDLNPNLIFAKDYKGNFTLANKAVADLYGTTPDEIVGKGDADFGLDLKEVEHFLDDDRRVMQTGETLFIPEETITSSSGEKRWLQTTKVALKNPEGTSGQILGVAVDISERKNAQDELIALYNATSFLFKADSLLNLGHQIVHAVIKEFKHADCGLLLVDKGQNKLVRLARAGEALVTTDAPLYLDGRGLVLDAVRTGMTVYAPDVSANPHYIPNDPRTRSELVIPLKTLKGVLGVFDLQSVFLNAFSQRDERVLTAFAERAAAAIENMQLVEEINRHAAELEWRVANRTAELLRTKDHVEAILNHSYDPIILINSDSKISQTNPAFDRQFGFQGDENYGLPLATLVQADHVERLESVLQTIAGSREPQRIELIAQRQDGTTFDADLVLAPIVQNEGSKLEIVCSMRDISASKRVEVELRQTLEKEKELNEMKSRFVSMISHEYRTPLTTILSSADLLRTYGDRLSAEQKEEKFDKIETQVRRMTELLEDILIISKRETLGDFNPEWVKLDDLTKDIVADIRQNSPSHPIDYSLGGDCQHVYLDTKLMRQVINNLISNAVKYSQEKSPVLVDVQCGATQIVLKVTDQGIGIPEEDQKRLFEVFHRAKNVGNTPGTGLGLVIVKQAVELHQGTIDFESMVNVGTTFTVVIPQGQ